MTGSSLADAIVRVRAAYRAGEISLAARDAIIETLIQQWERT